MSRKLITLSWLKTQGRKSNLYIPSDMRSENGIVQEGYIFFVPDLLSEARKEIKRFNKEGDKHVEILPYEWLKKWCKKNCQRYVEVWWKQHERKYALKGEYVFVKDLIPAAERKARVMR